MTNKHATFLFWANYFYDIIEVMTLKQVNIWLLRHRHKSKKWVLNIVPWTSRLFAEDPSILFFYSKAKIFHLQSNLKLVR